MKNFMEIVMKKNSDRKPLTFGVWGLKPNLGQIGPKTFGKRLIKPLVENPSSKFHKQDLVFLQNHEMNAIKCLNLKKRRDLGVKGLKATFGPLGPRKRIQS